MAMRKCLLLRGFIRQDILHKHLSSNTVQASYTCMGRGPAVDCRLSAPASLGGCHDAAQLKTSQATRQHMCLVNYMNNLTLGSNIRRRNATTQLASPPRSTARYQCLQSSLEVAPLVGHTSYEMPSNPHAGRAPVEDAKRRQEAYLPSLSITEDTEKMDPAWQTIIPISDPNPLQRVIDQGAPVIRKEAALMLKIRHKKMKKHQLKKLRKRMRFLWRRILMKKAKKKEKVIRAYEDTWKKRADAFDAEEYVMQMLGDAKKGGWTVDLFESQKRGKSV